MQVTGIDPWLVDPDVLSLRQQGLVLQEIADLFGTNMTSISRVSSFGSVLERRVYRLWSAEEIKAYDQLVDRGLAHFGGVRAFCRAIGCVSSKPHADEFVLKLATHLSLHPKDLADEQKTSVFFPPPPKVEEPEPLFPGAKEDPDVAQERSPEQEGQNAHTVFLRVIQSVGPSALAVRMHSKPSTLNGLKSKSSLSLEMALRLARAIGTNLESVLANKVPELLYKQLTAWGRARPVGS